MLVAAGMAQCRGKALAVMAQMAQVARIGVARADGVREVREMVAERILNTG